MRRMCIAILLGGSFTTPLALSSGVAEAAPKTMSSPNVMRRIVHQPPRVVNVMKRKPPRVVKVMKPTPPRVVKVMKPNRVVKVMKPTPPRVVKVMKPTPSGINLIPKSPAPIEATQIHIGGLARPLAPAHYDRPVYKATPVLKAPVVVGRPKPASTDPVCVEPVSVMEAGEKKTYCLKWFFSGQLYTPEQFAALEEQLQAGQAQ